MQGRADDPLLPAATFDLILMVDVYHELAAPQVFVRKLKDALKPDGRLVLIEFRLEDPSVPIREVHKMSVSQVRQELGADGFRIERVIDVLPWQHIIVLAPAAAARLRQLFEWIEDLEPRPLEVSIVPRDDHKSVAARGCRDVAVLNRHALSRLVEQTFLLRPDVGNRHVEPVDTSMQRVNQTPEPRLQCLTLSAFFCSNPVRQLRDNDGTRVAPILLRFEPGNDLRVAVPLRWLADDVRIEQPAHSLRRLAGARRRGGTRQG